MELHVVPGCVEAAGNPEVAVPLDQQAQEDADQEDVQAENGIKAIGLHVQLVVEDEESAAYEGDCVPGMFWPEDGGHVSAQENFFSSALDEDKEDQREDQRLELVEAVLYGVGESGEQAKQAVHREANEKSFGQRAEFAGQGAFREDGQGVAAGQPHERDEHQDRDDEPEIGVVVERVFLAHNRGEEVDEALDDVHDPEADGVDREFHEGDKQDVGLDVP